MFGFLKPKPYSFEISEVMHDYKSKPVVKKYITVLEQFKHHYTGMRMVNIRIEYDAREIFPSASHGNESIVEYKTIPEGRLDEYIEKQFVW